MIATFLLLFCFVCFLLLEPHISPGTYQSSYIFCWFGWRTTPYPSYFLVLAHKSGSWYLLKDVKPWEFLGEPGNAKAQWWERHAGLSWPFLRLKSDSVVHKDILSVSGSEPIILNNPHHPQQSMAARPCHWHEQKALTISWPQVLDHFLKKDIMEEAEACAGPWEAAVWIKTERKAWHGE